MDAVITLGTAGLTYGFTPVQSRVARGVLAFVVGQLAFVAFGKNSVSRATRLMLWGRNPKVLRPYGANLKNWKELLGKKNKAIIMIHGSPGNAGLMYPIIKAMHEKGVMENYVVFAENWETGKGLGKGFKRLKGQVEEIRLTWEKAGIKDGKVYVVGHSWGSILTMLAKSRGLALPHPYLGAGRVAVEGGKYNFSEGFLKLCGIYTPELKYIQEIQRWIQDLNKRGQQIPGQVTVIRSNHDGLVPGWASNLKKMLKVNDNIKDVVLESDHLSIVFDMAPLLANAFSVSQS